MKTKTNTLRGLALAGAIAMISAEQSAEAVIIFDVIDANTYTLTADGGSLDGGSNYYWGVVTSGTLHFGNLSDNNDAYLYQTGGVVHGQQLSVFAGAPIALADGNVITVTNVTSVDLTTLTLPAAPLALDSVNSGPTTGNVDLVYVPEPSSAGLLALAGCALMLRRKRK